MIKQRLVFVTIYVLYLNAILNLNGQITSCYVGTTFANDFGTTLTQKCSNFGTPPHTACKVSKQFFFQSFKESNQLNSPL